MDGIPMQGFLHPVSDQIFLVLPILLKKFTAETQSLQGAWELNFISNIEHR